MIDQQRVEQFINAYEPAWKPQAPSLRGTVIVIDPTGGCASESVQRLSDDLSVVTGAVLFHYIQQAGGTPIMTRVDEQAKQSRAREEAEEGRPASDSARNLSNADIAITLSFATPQATNSNQSSARIGALTDNKHSIALCQSLNDAFDNKAATGETSPPQNEAHVAACGVDITVPKPEHDQHQFRCVPREIAKRICLGLIALVENTDFQSMVRTNQESTPPPTPVPRFVDRTPELEMLETARRVWPHGDLPIEYAAWFCNAFVRSTFSDLTFVYFQPHVTVEKDAVRIKGATNVVLLQNTLVDALRCVGVTNVTNEMRVLPNADTLGVDRVGVCVTSMAMTYASPSESAGPRSQLLYAEPVRLLDRTAGFLLVHADDGYWGWVREECIRIADDVAFKPYAARRRAVIRRDINLTNRRIVRGSVLPIVAESGNRVTLAHPAGDPIELSATDVHVQDDADAAAARVAAALELLHIPYVYGAESPLGLDCSGLAKRVCLRTGTSLPRDAGQQFMTGRLVATCWDRSGIEPGDLLYFINACGRVYHVGIALSPTHFVHSGPPEVKIDSLQEGDRLYSAERARTFLAARRLY